MFPLASLFLLLLPFFYLSPISAQADDTPEMVFDCSVTPGVCTNMCFGAYCRDFEVSLYFDQPSDATKSARRNKAGCGKDNRCSKDSPDPDGPSCDEYQFASTSNADNVQACNRCVPTAEQNSQGGTISSFYQNQLGGKPGDFIVGFGNPDDKSVQYCEYDTECNNDGNQYCGDDLCPDGKPSKMKHKRNHYVTQGGLEFISTRDLAPGHRVVRMAKRDMEDVGEVAGLFARDVEDNSEAVDDEVMEQIWKE